jgi:hypothetical protein
LNVKDEGRVREKAQKKYQKTSNLYLTTTLYVSQTKFVQVGNKLRSESMIFLRQQKEHYEKRNKKDKLKLLALTSKARKARRRCENKECHCVAVVS